MGVNAQTLSGWRKKCAGVTVREVWELIQLREENAKLRALVADFSLDKHMLQELVAKRF